MTATKFAEFKVRVNLPICWMNEQYGNFMRP